MTVKNIKISAMLVMISLAFLSCAKTETETIVTATPKLQGYWRITDGSNVTQLSFDENSFWSLITPGYSFSLYGTYTLNEDILSLYDATCGAYLVGEYRVNLTSPSTLELIIINDKCTQRAGFVTLKGWEKFQN